MTKRSAVPGARKGKAKTSPSLTRAAQRASTREQIRAAAWDLFSTVGFDKTTTQAIAERAGVAAGTVFIHASDKADLLFLVMHDRLESVVNERFETLPQPEDSSSVGPPLIDRLMHVFRGLFVMYGQHPGVGAAFVKHLPGANGPNAQRVNTLTYGFLHRVGLLVTEAQSRDEVARDLNPIACAQNVFGLYFMALLGWLSGHFTLETALDPILRSALELQIRGFRP